MLFMGIKYRQDNFANNLKILREKTGKSQIKVSTEMDINHRTYQRLENNEIQDVKLSIVIKILKYYDINLEELLR